MLNTWLVVSTFEDTGNHAQKSEAAKAPRCVEEAEALKTQKGPTYREWDTRQST